MLGYTDMAQWSYYIVALLSCFSRPNSGKLPDTFHFRKFQAGKVYITTYKCRLCGYIYIYIYIYLYIC